MQLHKYFDPIARFFLCSAGQMLHIISQFMMILNTCKFIQALMPCPFIGSK